MTTARGPGRPPPSFRRDILPLFRSSDREEMLWAFDLFDFADVSRNAIGILVRVEDGGMPCDRAWTAESVALFARWLDTGTAP